MIPEPLSNSPTWPHVLEFAKRMEYKLSANRHKGGREDWLKDGRLDLVNRILDELDEVKSAIANGSSPKDIANECADVANFAMMVADWTISKDPERY